MDELAGRGHKVYVAAPSTQKSGSGKGVWLKARVWEVSYPGAVRAWAVSSTPASIVYMAVRALLPEPPDYIVSGVNHGPNMGFEDFFTSGTIGAAIEGAFLGVPSIAASTTERKVETPRVAYSAARIVSGIIGSLSEDERRTLKRESTVLIVNSPVNPRGVRAGFMAWNTYNVDVEIGGDTVYAVMDEEKIYDPDPPPGSDIWFIRKGYAVVTPVSLRAMWRGSSPEQLVSLLERIVENLRV
ncbi:MAG: hypothetical protein LRS48_02395 [Desulfurococcales archaeon]|nr:hypothetical protein [Desulfurococcales archaeon]